MEILNDYITMKLTSIKSIILCRKLLVGKWQYAVGNCKPLFADLPAMAIAKAGHQSRQVHIKMSFLPHFFFIKKY
jgi:hypothetical protein